MMANRRVNRGSCFNQLKTVTGAVGLCVRKRGGDVTSVLTLHRGHKKGGGSIKKLAAPLFVTTVQIGVMPDTAATACRQAGAPLFRHCRHAQ